MKEIPITVLILTKNEELAILDCLRSVSNFHQVIVVDSNSSDRTVEFALANASEVINFSWNGRYPKKKQWALELPNIQNDWVLYLDADERITPELESEIRGLLDSNLINQYAAVEITLSYRFMQRELKYGHRVRKIALLNRKFCSFPEYDDLHVQNMWEVEGHYQPMYHGKLLRLKSKLRHDDPDGLYDYFARHNRYSDWEAEVIVNPSMSRAVRANRTLQGKLFSQVPFKSIFFFVYSYIFRMGFRDRKAGFQYAIALSFYYWQIAIKVRERLSNENFSKI